MRIGFLTKQNLTAILLDDQGEHMRRMTRVCVYGIIIEQDKLLLTAKRSGCYVGMLDLPGGGIEFGEMPEEALVRELREEIGLEAKSWRLVGNYGHNQRVESENLDFHQLCQIYRIGEYRWIGDVEVEEVFDWYHLKDVLSLNLTPITRKTLLEVKRG